MFDRLDAAQEERLRDHRARTARLRQMLAEPQPDAGGAGTPYVHTVKWAAEGRAIYNRLLQNAVEEVLVFNLPPYSSPDASKRRTSDPAGQDEVNPHVLAAIDRGVRFRALYESSQWHSAETEPFRLAMTAYHRAGVKGRLVDDLPTKLAVADRASVLLALPDPQQQIGFPPACSSTIPASPPFRPTPSSIAGQRRGQSLDHFQLADRHTGPEPLPAIGSLTSGLVALHRGGSSKVVPKENRSSWEESAGRPAPSSTTEQLRRELEELGLSSYEARVLLALLQHGPANSADLAKVAGVPRTSAYQVIEELGARRLVERVQGGRAATWACPGVDLVFDRIDAAQEDRLRELRARTARLRRALEEPPPTDDAIATPFVHTIRGAAEVRAIYDRLLAGAADEVLVFNLPPYSTPEPTRQTPTDVTGQDEVNPLVLEAIERGVQFRALYQAAHWSEPAAEPFRKAMAAYHRAGVKGRLADELPTKLAVADRSSVLLALSDPRQQIGFPINLFVDHPGFAALQADAFAHRWRTARPIPRDR